MESRWVGNHKRPKSFIPWTLKRTRAFEQVECDLYVRPAGPDLIVGNDGPQIRSAQSHGDGG
jgi:hypothetical protein